MKYFESQTDFSSASINSPVDLVRFIVTCVFLSPIRLVLEVSKKVMFTGEFFKKFILNCIYINSALIFLSVMNTMFVTKKFYLYGSLLPISSLVLSFFMLIGLYFLSNKFPLEVDLESSSVEGDLDNIANVYSVDKSEIDDSNLGNPINSGNPSNSENPSNSDGISNLINPSSSNQHSSNPSNPSIHSTSLEEDDEIEINTEEDFDKVYKEEADKQLEKVPSNIKAEIAAKLEAHKKKLEENLKLHENSSSVKNGFKDVKDQEEDKINQIKESYRDFEDDGFNSSVEKLTSLIRPGKMNTANIDVEHGDDSMYDLASTSLNEYNKSVMSKVNRKSVTLDSLRSSNNASTLIDLDDENSNTPSVPSTPSKSSSLSEPSSTSSSLNNISYDSNDSNDSNNSNNSNPSTPSASNTSNVEGFYESLNSDYPDDMFGEDLNDVDSMSDPLDFYLGGGLN